MTAAGPLATGGHEQRRSEQSEKTIVPPRPTVSSPFFAAVATSAGSPSPSPRAMAAGGAGGRGVGQKGAPARGDVMREGLSSSPPLPRSKRKKVPPPLKAAAIGAPATGRRKG